MQLNFYKNKLGQNEFIIHFIKYGIVGFSNFLVTGAVYYILLRVLFVWYPISFMLSWGIGVLYTYLINFIWVFKPEEKIEFKHRLWKYFLVYATSLIVNLTLLTYIVEVFSLDPFWSQFLIIPIVVLINFIGIKYWALRKRTRILLFGEK
jgi:putative flippase GtrA